MDRRLSGADYARGASHGMLFGACWAALGGHPLLGLVVVVLATVAATAVVWWRGQRRSADEHGPADL